MNVAWPYANGPRHIGHVAGFGVPSDVYARYERMKGNDVLMVSGTDEHGTPILVEADKEGVSAQELANRYNRVIAKDLCDLGLSYDLFTRTTTGNHEKVVQELFKQCLENGYIYKGTQKVAISPSTGRTLPDRYIEGTCPICGADGARGDQCDACGNELDPDELLNPVSKINGETPRFEETEHFFLDLPALAEANLAWLKTREGWRTNVINFSIGLFKEVKPRAITRDIDWGIPVPVKGWIDNPNKKLYVWFDAVIGYLSASIEWARRKGDPEAWRAWWNDPTTPGYYFMGKDNITFHSQIWPSEMLAYNGQGSKGGETGKLGPLNMPEQVVASEFMTMEGKKFSSSRGIVIYVKDILARYPVDAVRYYISVAGPESSDSDFTWAEFVRHNNEELAASWGNLVNRVANLINKNFGEIPAFDEASATDEDRALLAETKAAFETVADSSRITARRTRCPKRCAWSATSTSTSPPPNRGRSKTIRPASAPCCTPPPRPCPTPTTCWPPSCRTPHRRCGRPSAELASSRRCLIWKRLRISTSRASRTRSSRATTSWAKPCIRGLPSRSWPAPRCRSRTRSSRRSRRRPSKRSSPASIPS